jgi:hypothetical protein
MANLSDAGVMLNNFSPEHQQYAPHGHFFQGACCKIYLLP